MGVNMSVESGTGVVDFDANTAAWLEQYKSAIAKIKELQEVADVAHVLKPPSCSLFIC